MAKILFVSEKAGWSTDWDIKELSTILTKLKISWRIISKPIITLSHGIYFFVNRHQYFNSPYRYGRGKIVLPYYHEDNNLKQLKRVHAKITKIQVTNRAAEAFVLKSGINPQKVSLIPIGINPKYFYQHPKQLWRERYHIPQDAIVVGSFQKDGEGWGKGLQPKLVKGPDIFLKTVRMLKESVPKLFILLSGPARGYVKKGLEKLKIPYKHIYLEHYPQISQLYHCLDLYIIASRQEGGPKAVLESMASGIPIISTRVGQATDMIKNGVNGFLVSPKKLSEYAIRVLFDNNLRSTIIKGGLETAQKNTYQKQLPLWSKFFKEVIK